MDGTNGILVVPALIFVAYFIGVVYEAIKDGPNSEFCSTKIVIGIVGAILLSWFALIAIGS